MFLVFLCSIMIGITYGFVATDTEKAKVLFFDRAGCKKINKINKINSDVIEPRRLIHYKMALYNMMRRRDYKDVECPVEIPWRSYMYEDICCRRSLREVYRESGVGKWIMKNKK